MKTPVGLISAIALMTTLVATAALAGPVLTIYTDRDSYTAGDAGLSDRTTQADGTPDTGTVDMGFHFPLP